MLSELLLLLSLALAPATQTPAAAPAAAEPAKVMSQEEIGAALVARLSAICASHPEVERAFVFGHADESGRTIYTFIPIFDRKVSDAVLNEADRAYRELIPDGPGLELMLLARNTWKRTLAKDPPIYVRPKSG